ncbi:MAG: ring,2-phenylacetyl-CoA epoxidase subunit PaaA [Solirubrobacteraceae bacterium]|jgi:ring-1,2-phenylacetyl-CoA epoxidase subunit PaaA|nr:ring,2-phenylacetyl-CoA epoxidase subunit PaaA [Solirubrobacteraceae bacterium]MEA2278216.1 ring,2-phenylacetyl-CoA epoxidase subunit PaaA [Solirubrobacteraceae bacterium]MEA2394979.1 ring,2-phenylacetyl-CoA epoxidase subunit PaaA [Solirubrobacteraceae bacterium]
MIAEDDLLQSLAQGATIEWPEQMSEGYLRELKRTLLISADTEFLGAVMHWPNLMNRRVPERFDRALLAIIQDELGHAHIDYRMLADLGEDIDALMYGREPHQFKHPYAMDMPYENFAESVVVGAFMDRAGYILLSDIFETTSYLPWRRALVKINKEEHFHINFGVRTLRALSSDPETKPVLQRAIDWMFPMTVEWFGLPDDRKTGNLQLDYRLKGRTNDELRALWLGQIVPLVESMDLHIPAHHDAAQERYVLDFHLPCAFDPEAKRWDLDEPVSWDDVIRRWKGRGPWNERLVECLQSGRKSLDAMRVAA